MVNQMIVILFIVLLWKVLFAEEIIIERNATKSDSVWISKPDKFIIPSSVCSGNGSVQCTAMGGTRISNCTCECNLKQNQIFYKSTFGFYDNQWKCTENTKVRRYGGCLLINLEKSIFKSSRPLITLPMSEPEYGYFVPKMVSNTASSVSGKGSYLTCDGKWEHINSSLIKESFHIRSNQYLHYTDKLLSSINVEGRVMKLAISFISSRSSSTPCVLFKIKGRLNCSISPATSVSPSHSMTPQAAPKTHNAKNTTTPTTMTTASFVNKNKSSPSTSDQSSMIAGATSGVIGLVFILIIVAIVLITRRRKKRNGVVKRQSEAVDNASYERGLESSLRITDRDQRSVDDEDYSYAYTNTITKNIRADTEDRHNNNREPNSTANLLYGKPTHPKTSIYSTLEDPAYAKVLKEKNNSKPNSSAAFFNHDVKCAKVDKAGKETQSDKRNEPLYNVLEGPGVENGAPGQVRGIEEPYPECAPVYDVLEGPESNEVPVNQPSQNGASVSVPRRKTPGQENRGYDDTCYDSVGDVITDTGDIYQQLNQDGQQKTAEYQPLRHPNVTMNMTNTK